MHCFLIIYITVFLSDYWLLKRIFISQFVSPPAAAVTPTGQRIVPAGPMSVAEAMAVRTSSTGLPHPAQFAAGISPALQMEAAHRAGLPPSPHVPMDRIYLNQRIMGSERADLAGLYNNTAFIGRQHQYPTAAAMQQAMFDMQNWQQQMRREQSFDRDSAERPAKVSVSQVALIILLYGKRHFR